MRRSRFAASTLVERWLLLTLGASLLSMFTAGWLADWTSLSPERILRGEVWRLVTWAFVEMGPMSLILTCVAIYKFGGDLAVRWGDQRLRRFMLEIIVGAAVVTTLLSLIVPMYFSRSAGWAIGDVLCIAWARQFPTAVVRVYGLLELSGKRLIALTVGVTVVFAIAYGPFVMAPELFACFAAVYYPHTRLARR
ncbi:MAG: rhomboid family intramembrane serine protease [Kofleriaceae bacterium]